MALFPTDDMKRDGIQLGGPDTLCYKCELERRANDPDSDIPYGKLQYKEVFKITQQGLDTCICMKHFKEMCATSHYMLIDTDECVAVPLTATEPLVVPSAIAILTFLSPSGVTSTPLTCTPCTSETSAPSATFNAVCNSSFVMSF